MKYSKSDQRFWLEKVSFRKVRGVAQKDLSVRIAFTDKLGVKDRQYFTLNTPNKKVAARKALEIFQNLQLNGWQPTLEKFKGIGRRYDDMTIGEWLELAEPVSMIRPETFYGNARALRQVAATIKKVPPARSGGKDQSRNPRSEAFQAWKKKVESIKLSELSKPVLQQYVRDYIKGRSENPVEQGKATRSIISKIAHARSIFSADIVEALQDRPEVTIPDPLPFHGLKLPKMDRSAMRYNSTIDLPKLIDEADKELYLDEYKAFILAVVAGLRRSEIDTLTWEQVSIEKKEIDVRNTEHIRLKSTASAGIVYIDDAVAEMMKEWKQSAESEFVIEREGIRVRNNTQRQYRANLVFLTLIKWLRSKGVTAQKPIHELRKEAGRLITEGHGIYAASRFLRHSGVQITAMHYADDTRKITTGLGSLIAKKGDQEDLES